MSAVKTSSGLSNLYRLASRLVPAGLRPKLIPLAHWVRTHVDPEARAHRAWVRDHYSPFGVAIREQVFLSIARFCHINRPISGYYFEFGSHSARTMKLCWKHTRHLFDWTYVAFDSFEGLPEIQDIDRQEIWAKGRLKTAEDEFVGAVTGAGMPRDRLITVKGFYDDSLTDELAARLAPRKAAAVYVDCDLYASTTPVLKFIKPFLQPGTIIVFDDWNCFIGDPEKGERLAWREFTEANPNLRFEPFVSNNEIHSFIYIGEKGEARE